jgi:CDP-2,3-bis-(O-geranylgeranyl)-sn-glycerol synthase
MNEWEAFWFFLPAGIANLVPALAAKVPGLTTWNTPMDFGRSWRGIRIFGNHKTWRGIVSGTFLAALVGLFQYRFIAHSAESTGFIITATAAMGCGALLGDALKSFFKRRHRISEGKSWFPFDQIDYIAGGLALVLLLVDLTAAQIARIFVIYFVLHLVVGYVSYLAGFKKTPV